eukprot:CAMPEP_0172552332 /NCGR_PEP_ID=MMETSP1067-20121228/44265_1 /TAXON_ID=265564 ORGANISM="Thalassiosira punctigera, Strain Tpunct2005C2" /NCGR_SAMPLE_ID=MMETSP1067 /ASSEMBLY_ACC=CAM_ASM_000444 /LENGTH=646 /DNA_ID=CAMNT_0013340289 /DNA_START=25 /DNA_END=1965 /DNA_ORIENTATION=-
MLILGFELQDVLQVVVGVALGLLTVYRRELSCNRGYQNDDDGMGDSLHRGLLQAGLLEGKDSSNDDDDVDDGRRSPSRRIRRRKSSSALPNMTGYLDDEHHHLVKNPCTTNNEDPTEELLEAAGLFLSGGPFLAASIAVLDHLFYTTFIGTFLSVSSLLICGFQRKTDVRDGHPCEEEDALQLFSESIHDGEDEATRRQKQPQHYLYSVAWHAATEYYANISAKLDGSPVVSVQQQNVEGLSMHFRSKSTGNLQQHLSDERCRALLLDMFAMANRGGMDVTLLPSDAQIVIFSYLPPKDVLSFTCTNRAGRDLLEDAVCLYSGTASRAAEDAVEIDDDIVQVGDGDTAMLIWKALFRRDYSWVLSDWKIGKEAVLRSLTHCNGQGLPHQQLQQQHSPNAGKVFHHLASTILDSEIDVDNFPMENVTLSMKDFYFTFTETWLNYTIAGCNSTGQCLIGLHGHVFDISNFVEDHPGSTETLLLQAGRDATVFFESMGHSLNARKLALGMCAVVNGQCARFHFTEEEGSNNNSRFQLRAGPLGPLFSTWGLIKPTSRSLDIKRNIVGFLIPRKRSRPRFQGGLHRIRERIQREEEVQLANAARWAEESLGPNGMFGGIHVYHDPFLGWGWWYTDRDFNAVFATPATRED